MAELVDALVSGTSGSNALEVRVFLSAPHSPFVWRAFWGCSSVDRALRSHRRGRGFESHQLHQKNSNAVYRRFNFFRSGTRTHKGGFEPQQKGRREYAGLRQQILQGRRSQSHQLHQNLYMKTSEAQFE